jgi:thioesterase domain-containing protein
MEIEGAGRLGDDALRLRSYLQAKQPPARPVVFVLPGLGGEDDPELEKFWGPLRPSLDLVPVSYMDWTEILEAGCDFDVIATHVRRQIESREPTGPIRMAGYSIGGHLAYATAVALEKMGRQVESVVILDAPVSIGGFTPPLRHRFRARVEGLFNLNLLDTAASLCAKVLTRDAGRPALRRLSRYRAVPLPLGFENYLHHKITMQLVQRIYPDWWHSTLERAIPLAGTARLFRSEEHEPFEQEDLGWASYCRNLKVSPVAGTHRGMLDSEVNGPLRAAFVEAMTARS